MEAISNSILSEKCEDQRKELEKALNQMHPDNPFASEMRKKYRELEEKENRLKVNFCVKN